MDSVAITTSPAPSFPATLRHAESGDNAGTATWRLPAEDVAQAVGHLKATKADAADPALTGTATAVNLTVSGATDLNGPTTLDGATTVNGSLTMANGAEFIAAQTVLADATATIDPNYHTYYLTAPTANRTISVNPGVVGQRIRFVRPSSGSFTWTIKRTGSGGTIATLAADERASVELEFTSSAWNNGWGVAMFSPNVTLGVDA